MIGTRRLGLRDWLFLTRLGINFPLCLLRRFETGYIDRTDLRDGARNKRRSSPYAIEVDGYLA